MLPDKVQSGSRAGALWGPCEQHPASVCLSTVGTLACVHCPLQASRQQRRNWEGWAPLSLTDSSLLGDASLLSPEPTEGTHRVPQGRIPLLCLPTKGLYSSSHQLWLGESRCLSVLFGVLVKGLSDPCAVCPYKAYRKGGWEVPIEPSHAGDGTERPRPGCPKPLSRTTAMGSNSIRTAAKSPWVTRRS